MSQLIPNHVLRVGQTMCLSSKEDVVLLGRSCPSVSPTCCSYSTDRWVSQPMKIRSQQNGTSTQNSGHNQICDKSGDNDFLTHCILSGSTGYSTKSQGTQVFSASGQHREEEGTAERDEGEPLSPTLDVSIDNLNQLILELDPSFQPIPVRPATHFNSRESSMRSERLAQDSHGDVEVSELLLVSRSTSTSRSSDRSITSAASHRVPIPPSSPNSCSTSGSLIFSSSPSRANTLPPQPCSRRGGSNGPTTQCSTWEHNSHSSLAHSPGSDNWPKPLHIHGQRMSGASLLSTSPGSDTSYVLGSAHSLVSEDADSPERKLFGSSGSYWNLNSPYSNSPDLQKTYFSDQNLEFLNSQSQNPSSIRAFKGQNPLSRAYLRGHPSSCPPSVTGSMVDIPVVLINGSPEHKDSVIPDSRNGHSSGTLGHRATMKKSCKASSTPAVNNVQPTMKFVMDTSKFWFKPHISRDQADALLKDQEPGSFIVRDSTSYRGAFGLAMKVDKDPLPSSRSDGQSSDFIKQYLIESSAKGVRLKGASEEPYFGSLSALVYQHAITKLALPRKLLIPTTDFSERDEHREDTSATQENTTPGSDSVLATACNLLYLNSVNMESLTGPLAVQKAVSITFETDPLPVPTIVNFKVSHKGIILTDIQRKLFFRRHYPANTLSYCGIDPEDRKWQKHCRSARIFGFIAKCQDISQGNVCHLFAEYDSLQPAELAIELARGLLKDLESQ
ncbi:tensin-4-like isoform X2 [Polyodon spathula]|uniref:tensin-4-like isoform X2 n=1 Tax=Polyodon spathula TaxID=7913 RepID=UPI001B7DB0CB|nr:tensin-4-like isoform X2 [Polyodon spathula]